MKKLRFWAFTFLLAQSLFIAVEGHADSNRASINTNGMVRLVYFLPSDRPARLGRMAALRQLIKDAQQFYADEMQKHGFGRKTFTVETDDNRDLIVHQVNGKFREEHYHNSATDYEVWAEIREHFDDLHHTYFVAIDLSYETLYKGMSCGIASVSFSPSDGGGFRLRHRDKTEGEEIIGGFAIIPASGHCFERLGLTTHELGHAFGLAHDFRQGRHNNYVMGYGKQNRLSDCAAEWLSVSRLFNTNSTFVNQPGKIQLLSSRTYSQDITSLRFKVTDFDGLHQVQLLAPEGTRWNPWLFDCKRLNGKTGTIESAVKTAELVDRVTLQMIDVGGNITWATIPIQLDESVPTQNALDVNSDGVVNLSDLAQLASRFGQRGKGPADVNEDGVVDIVDVLLVAAHMPALSQQAVEMLTEADVQQWLTHAKQLEVENEILQKGIVELERLLAVLTAVTVDIPDPKLRAAIETALKVAPGTQIVSTEMETLFRLDAKNANIGDLTGLEYATNLQSLWLDGEEVRPGIWGNSNSVSDLSPLEGLTQLERLDLWQNSVTDISALIGLTNLTHLGLVGNNISDMSVLTGLTNLESLWLDGNPIADISALAGLTQLIRLGLDSTSISDISALAGLTNLTWMRMERNNISDLSPLVANAGLGTGDEIYVRGNPLSYQSIHTHIPILRSKGVTVEFDNRIPTILLKISGDDQKGLSGEPLTHPFVVEVRDGNGDAFEGVPVTFDVTAGGGTLSVTSPATDENGRAESTLTLGSDTGTNTVRVRVEDISGSVTFNAVVKVVINIPDPSLRAAIEATLDKASGDPIATADMAKLTELNAPEADISSLTGLEHATNLTSLNLQSNNIQDISPLGGLTKLTALHLMDNKIENISPLAGLTNLTELSLGSNAISHTSPLRELTNLTFLSLSNTGISDISPLEELTNLTRLDLDSNTISNISALAELTNLTTLMLQRNAISNISPLSELTNLTSLRLWNNSISDILALAGLTDLTWLQLDSNVISNISSMAELTNLTNLTLYNNLISDISSLVANTGLGEGDTIDVGGNSLSYSSIHTHIPTLQERGVDVAFNDRTPTTLLKISGDDQKGIYGETLTHPFVVEVRDGNGDAFEGVPVVFDVTAGGGTLSVTSPTTDENGRAESTFTLGNNVGMNTVSVSAAEIQGTVTFNAVAEGLDFDLSVPMGTSLIHVPLKVTAVDGVAKILTSIADLYDVLGGASSVNFLITYDSQVQEWRSYFGVSDKGTSADRELTDEMGIIAGMIAPVSLRLSGIALGTDGNSSITLSQGLNVVGLPLRDSRVTRVSDLLRIDGIWGNVPVITVSDGGKFKVVRQVGDPGDIAITGGGAFILNAQQPATVAISGEAWTNVSEAAAAPLITRKGIEVGDTTPVLGLRGSVADEEAGLKVEGFRVTVKNLSTGRAVTGMIRGEEAGYRLTVVDIETARAATIGDILEILAQSPSSLIGVQPLWYTVTAEDVRQSLIQLPALIAYEIPSETELLRNYPNPFNPETWIPYRLAEDAFVILTIYDGSGRVIRTLDVGHRIAAVYESRSKAIHWDGRNDLGEQVASGVYFYTLTAGDFSATRRVVIIK